MQAVKYVCVALSMVLALLLLAILVLHFHNLNAFRGLIAEASKENLGRELRIHGDLDGDLISICPTVVAHDLEFENAAWASKQPMLQAKRLAVGLCLWPLVKGRVHFKTIELSDARLLLEQGQRTQDQASIRWNFVLDQMAVRGDSRPEAKSPAGDKPLTLPIWEQLQVNGLKVEVQAPDTQKASASITKLASHRAGQNQPAVVRGQGQVEGMPWKLEGQLEASAVSTDNEWRYELSAAIAEARLKSSGTIGDLKALDMVTGDLSVDAQNIEDIAQAFRVALSNTTPAITLTTGFERQGASLRLGALALSLGQSQIEGWLALDLKQRPDLRGVLTSPQLRIADLTALLPSQDGSSGGDDAIGGKAASEAAKFEDSKSGESPPSSPSLFSQKPLPLKPLSALDLKLELTVEKLIGPKKAALLDQIYGDLSLNEGALTLSPLKVSVADGVVEAKVILDASDLKMPKAEIDMAIRDINLRQALTPFVPDIEVANLDDSQLLRGELSGSVKLAGRGQSAHTVVSSLDGDIGLTVEDGEVAALLVEAAGLDLTQALGTLSKPPPTFPIDCMLAKFNVQDGIIVTDGVIIGTPDSNIIAGGQINLPLESMNMEVRTLAKDFSIGTIKTPIAIKGSLTKPKVELKKAPLVARAAAALVLGAIGGPAATLAFVEPGAEKTGRCADYRHRIAQIKSDSRAVAH